MKMVQKTTAAERINHFFMLASFLILAITGFGFAFRSLNGLNALFGGNAIAALFHSFSGIAFALTVLFSMGSSLSEALRFDSSDSEWLSKLGGYFDKNAELPPQGKMNFGQKMFYLVVVLACGLFISISGFILWGGQGGMLFAHFLHYVSFMVMIFAVPVHIYLATLANPGTARIMSIGTVPLWWAKKKYGKWVSEEGLDK